MSVTVTVPPAMCIPPPCQTRKVLTFGQFREVSSAGGVGRKFEERAAYSLRFHGRYAEAGIDHQRSVQGNFFRRGPRNKVHGQLQSKGEHVPPVKVIREDESRREPILTWSLFGSFVLGGHTCREKAQGSSKSKRSHDDRQ